MRDLVTRNRSYRRFDESVPVSLETLLELVELACYTPSAANRQPLRYMTITDPEECLKVFGTLQWAGYLREWPGPAKGERPTAYIIVLSESTLSSDSACDSGIAAQTMLLGAVEKGYGGCIIASVDRARLRSLLHVEDRYLIHFVIALGKPAETVVIDQFRGEGDIRYWRDTYGIHHVPKRVAGDVVINHHKS